MMDDCPAPYRAAICFENERSMAGLPQNVIGDHCVFGVKQN